MNYRYFCSIYIIILMMINMDQCNAENKKYNRFLAYLFRKYGNGATISFEGLEHLMHNLGIGDLEFNPSHTIEEHFPIGYTPPDITSDEEGFESSTTNIENRGTNVLQTDTINVLHYNDKFQILTNEVVFKEMHDPKHFHPKNTEIHNHHDHGHGQKVHDYESQKKSTKICLSPRGILNLIFDEKNNNEKQIKQEETTYSRLKKSMPNENPQFKETSIEDEHNENVITSFKISPSTFLKICPALLVQLDQQICTEAGDPNYIESTKSLMSSEFLYACIYASISIFILSACGLLGILIVPLMKSFLYNEILKFLVAVAVGTLGGDALMHLLPHALEANSISSSNVKNSHHDMDSILIFGCTFLTVIFMYCIESFLPLIQGNNLGGHGHSHGAPNYQPNLYKKDIEGEKKNKKIDSSPDSNVTMLDENITDSKDNVEIDAAMTPVAFMVVIGDGLHNLTDGLAIGAAFAADPVTGMATAFAVLCHELPHELGDFALLIQTGLSIRRAVYLNIVSSILSFIGMGFGLVVAGIHTGMVKWIYACTAGSFLYIALTDLIPELEKSGKSLPNSLIQIFGILLGGLIMLLIALNENSLRLLFQ